jgi:hypothetical protein
MYLSIWPIGYGRAALPRALPASAASRLFLPKAWIRQRRSPRRKCPRPKRLLAQRTTYEAYLRKSRGRFPPCRKPSPAGTAELSLGRSPGLGILTIMQSRRDDWQLPRMQSWVLISEYSEPLVLRSMSRSRSSRPYGTSRWRMPTPGLRPGLSSVVPTGL